MRLLLIAALLLAPVLSGEQAPPTWTVNLQGGFADTFQMTLGGTFGAGPDWWNRMSVGVNNVLRDGDNVSVFGWSTTDLPTSTANWQAGLMYKARVLKTKRQSLSIGGGIQRWVLPSVKTGAIDWIAAGTLSYSGSFRRLPITVTQDSWSLLRSTLPTGSVLYTQIYTQHPIHKGEAFQLSFRHGPAHTYSWNFYGANGNRVVRYNAMLVASWRGVVIEGGVRQQFGLQDNICNNRFWTFGVSRTWGAGAPPPRHVTSNRPPAHAPEGPSSHPASPPASRSDEVPASAGASQGTAALRP